MTIDTLKLKPEIIRVYTTRLPLVKNGREYLCKCPFHSEKTPSFTVFHHEGTWLFKCMGCGVAGGVAQFVEKFDKVPFKEAVQRIENLLHSSWDKTKKCEESLGSAIDDEKSYKTYTLKEYEVYEKALADNKFVQNWIKTERGIDYETAKKLRLGYRQTIRSDKPKLQDILDKGWVVFPRVEGGKVLCLHYRSIIRKAFARQSGMATALFNTETIDPFEAIFVTEGEFDTCVLEQSGYRAVSIPNATTEITADMKDQIMRADHVILAGDCDNSVGSDKMQKLWAELQDRTFLLKWPEGSKDANDAFLKHCKGDGEAFKILMLDLISAAKSVPMNHVFNLAESMKSSQRTNLKDHPRRLRMPWPSVDKMAVLLPGSVMGISATNTKQGKTQFCTQLSLHAARYHGEVVINYQAELDIDEFSNIVASHVLKKSRNNITAEDYKEAANQLEGVKYYIGRNPTFNTVEPVLELMEQAIRRLGGTLCIIDHIHFLCRNTQNEITTQADAMQKLKNLAVKYGCKIIVVSQPRKAQSNAKGKVLHVTDIKGSETLTSDADAIFAIHRDIIKNKDESTKDDYSPVTEVHLLGARSKGDGSTFAKLYFAGDICTFNEIEYQHSESTATPQEESIF